MLRRAISLMYPPAIEHAEASNRGAKINFYVFKINSLVDTMSRARSTCEKFEFSFLCCSWEYSTMIVELCIWSLTEHEVLFVEHEVLNVHDQYVVALKK